jgi:hypothetical protein
MTWSPGWWVDPGMPKLDEEAPRCDHCGRRLTDIATRGGRLPYRHTTQPRRLLYDRACPRTRDDLLGLILAAQYDAAGLPIPERREPCATG